MIASIVCSLMVKQQDWSSFEPPVLVAVPLPLLSIRLTNNLTHT